VGMTSERIADLRLSVEVALSNPHDGLVMAEALAEALDEIERLTARLAEVEAAMVEMKPSSPLDLPCIGCGDTHWPWQHAPECTERCPHCGSEGPDLDHCEGCPTLNTCAQVEPSLPGPWHRDEDWMAGRPWDSHIWRDHLRDAHPGWRPT